MQIKTWTPTSFQEYELLDCGNFEKLERFGDFILIRPEPQALWHKVWSEEKWKSVAHAKFEQLTSSSGQWKKYKPMPDEWNIKYKSAEVSVKLRLALTGFKHVGIFPEQCVNWDYISQQIKARKGPTKVLNLFAYTGGASIAAKDSGADVIHLDSVKQVVSWAKKNQDLNNLTDIRWLIEDARKFVQREKKRGNVYDGIILDPPAYGLGPSGERWKLEEHIYDLLVDVKAILDPKGFMVLNTYSLGFSALVTKNLLDTLFNDYPIKETGELYLQSTSNMHLPLGVIGRVSYC